MKKKVVTIVSIAVFSTLLWGFVSLSKEYFATFNVPVSYRNILQDKAISLNIPDSISISVKGQGWDLAALKLQRGHKYYVYASADSLKEKISMREELNKNTWLSTNLQIIEFNPEFINFRMEERSTKQVPIKPNIKKNIKPGYGIVSDIEISPDSVEISGPKTAIEEIDTIFTISKKYQNIERKFSELIPLRKKNRINYRVDRCSIGFDVQKIVDKTFREVIVETSNVPASQELILFPSKVNIVLRGGIIKLGRLNADELKPYVKFNQALNDTLGYVTPQIELPEYIRLIDFKPSKLEYIIKKF